MDILKIMQDLLREMLSRKASDIHICAGHVPMMRVQGELEPSQFGKPLSPEETREMAYSLMRESLRMRFEQKMETDFAFSLSSGERFRVNVYTQRGLVNIALRSIPADIPVIDTLGIPPVVKKLAEERRGLILVTGTTGCGKSTTLAAMIDYINATRKAHIMTIEDPIEFLHRNKKSIVNQRELGLDTLSYGDALRNVVRQDPNVILLGEMRDLETMSAAITSAQTGHLVLSTVHTTHAIQTVHRIVDMFPPHQQNQVRLQLAETLKGVISQRLLPRSDITGRAPAVEVLVVTPLVKKAIEENNFAEVYHAIRTGGYYGMQTFNQALLTLYNEGKITVDDALAASSNPEEFMLSIRGIEATSAGAQAFDPQQS